MYNFACKTHSSPSVFLTNCWRCNSLLQNNTKLLGAEQMRIVSPSSQAVFLGVKDPATQLFFLQSAQPSTSGDSHTFLARSYGGGTTSDTDQLWKLHLRHGHRNFADIARQYQLLFQNKCLPALPVSWANHMCILICRMDLTALLASRKDFIRIFVVHSLFQLRKDICTCSPSSMTTVAEYLVFSQSLSQNGLTSGRSLWCELKRKSVAPASLGCFQTMELFTNLDK